MGCRTDAERTCALAKIPSEDGPTVQKKNDEGPKDKILVRQSEKIWRRRTPSVVNAIDWPNTGCHQRCMRITCFRALATRRTARTAGRHGAWKLYCNDNRRIWSLRTHQRHRHEPVQMRVRVRVLPPDLQRFVNRCNPAYDNEIIRLRGQPPVSLAHQ